MSVTSGTQFPQGHRARGAGQSLRDLPGIEAGLVLVQNRGRDWYVDSVNGAASNPGTQWGSAVTTLAAAIALASSGDRIHIAPGHTESLATAGAITLSKSGLTIVGYGRGNTRPTFTWTATAATFLISGTDNTIVNIVTKVGVDEVVSMFSVTAARNALLAVDFVEAATGQAIQWLLTDANADDLEIGYCRHVQAANAGSAQVWIKLIGADRAYIHDNTFLLKLNDAAGSAVIGQGTTLCADIEVSRNNVKMTGFSAALVNAFTGGATTTGLVAYNNIGTDTAANTTVNDFAGCYSFANLITNAVDKSGILDPVADT